MTISNERPVFTQIINGITWVVVADGVDLGAFPTYLRGDDYTPALKQVSERYAPGWGDFYQHTELLPSGEPLFGYVARSTALEDYDIPSAVMLAFAFLPNGEQAMIFDGVVAVRGLDGPALFCCNRWKPELDKHFRPRAPWEGEHPDWAPIKAPVAD